MRGGRVMQVPVMFRRARLGNQLEAVFPTLGVAGRPGFVESLPHGMALIFDRVLKHTRPATLAEYERVLPQVEEVVARSMPGHEVVVVQRDTPAFRRAREASWSG